MPYIPSSLRMDNHTVIPNRLRGNQTLEEIVEEGKEENESRKMKLADVAIKMTRAVIEETKKALRVEFIDALGELAELLVVAFEEHAALDLKYEHGNCLEEIASYAAYIFILNHINDDSDVGHVLGLTDRHAAMKMYRQHFNCQKIGPLIDRTCEVAKLLAEKVADSLGEIMEELTVNLFDFHRQTEKSRKAKAQMKAIKAKHEQRKKNDEMLAKIAAEEN